MKHPGLTEIYGTAAMQTHLSLEELAEIISTQLFGGIPFGGKERSIWEEVPAVYINTPVLGLLVILGRGSNPEAPGNCFVLKISPWGDFDRYIYRNKISNRRITQDNYLYHLLKFSLRNYPQVEILASDREGEKEYLFKLADRIVHHFDSMLNREYADYMTFKEASIDTSSLKIVFSNAKDKAVCSLSLDPLDMPWTLQVKVILEQGGEFELNKWSEERAENDRETYEVSPILLEDPKGLGDALAMNIARDTFIFYREIMRK